MKRPCFSVLFIFSILISGYCMGEEGSAKPRLGPGALITIPPQIDYDSVYNRADMVELLATLPKVAPELADDVRFDPEHWARDVRYLRDVWCLQFRFKPVRIIAVDIPNKEGTFDKKNVWYLVYNVKNVGSVDLEAITKERTIQTEDGERTVKSVEYDVKNPGGSIGTDVGDQVEMPTAKDTVAVSEAITVLLPGADTVVDLAEAEKRLGIKLGKTEVKQTRDGDLVLRNLPGYFEPVPALPDGESKEGGTLPMAEGKSITFEPQFILATDRLVLGTKSENNPETGKVESVPEVETVSYVDQVIPIALGPIIKKEGMTAIPETTVSITKKAIKPGEDLWGVAMWTDVDPRINPFSIYVSGLTNAYRWIDDGTNSGKVGEGRSMERKVLKTNWWRIGDRFTLNDSQIQYGQPGTVDYEWIFR